MMARAMIAISPSIGREAWDAWLHHYRGTKNESRMREAVRVGGEFYVWTRLPPVPAARADRAPRKVEQPAPVMPPRRVIADGEIAQVAARLEVRAELDRDD